MKKNHYVSKLDLKLLDMKFITINNDHSSIKSYKNNQQTELPSIITTSQDKSFIDFENYHYKNHRIKKQSTLSCENRIQTDHEIKMEIDKYRRKIENIKKQNSQIHKEIYELYRQGQANPIADSKVKPVKKIIVYKEKQRNQRHISLRKPSNLYERLYEKEQLGDQAQNIRKMLLNSNLQKSFQQYLISKNKRIPEFMKRLR